MIEFREFIKRMEILNIDPTGTVRNDVMQLKGGVRDFITQVQKV